MTANSESTEHLYGLNPAFELLRAGKRVARRAYINQSARRSPRILKLSDFLERQGVPMEFVEKGRLYDLCRCHDHQGVVLETTPYPYSLQESMLDLPRLLLLDNIEDPHNVGAILRSAEVFGFRGVCLPKRGVPGVYASVAKISAGAAEHLQIAHNRSANQYARAAAEAGYAIMVLDPKGALPLQSAEKMDFEKLMVVIGGEDKSVGQFILNMADHVVAIEQSGRVSSLNASVSAGIALHALKIGAERDGAST